MSFGSLRETTLEKITEPLAKQAALVYNPVLNTYRKAKWLNLPVCGNFSHFCFLRFVVRKPYPEIFLIFLFSSFGW